MSLLASVLTPATGLVNRRIRENTAALALTRSLAGRELAVRVSQSALALTLAIDPDGLRIVEVASSEPDVIIEGSLSAIARLAGPDPLAVVRSGDVTMTGDVELAEDFQKLLALVRPDVGDELARAIGPDAAAGIGNALASIGAFGREQLKSGGDWLAKTLSEREQLPSASEMDEFVSDVRATRDRAARLAAEIARLERRTDD